MAASGAGANEDPTDYTKHTNLLSLMCANYVPSLTREQAETYLIKNNRWGVFRESLSDKNAIVFTFKNTDGKIQHSLISLFNITSDGTTQITMDGLKRYFPGQIGGRRSTRRHNKKRRSTRRR